jgi:hypothetical protein
MKVNMIDSCSENILNKKIAAYMCQIHNVLYKIVLPKYLFWSKPSEFDATLHTFL